MSHHHPTHTIERRCDVCIVGGSAAGLAAALQLGRARRSVIVVDAGDPRNGPAEHLHGYLGHEGSRPSELLTAGREEVRSYGGEVLDGRAVRVSTTEAGDFRVELLGGHSVIARRVLAATGLTDELPDIDGLARHWGRDVLHCPFCHGFEVRDRRIALVVTHPSGLHPAPLLRQLSPRLTVVVHDAAGLPDPDTDTDGTGDTGDTGGTADSGLAALRAGGVDVRVARVIRVVTGPDGRVAALELAGQDPLDVDAVVVGPRFTPRIEPFLPLGLRPSPHPSGLGEVVVTDAVGATAVPGLYAAGNLTDPSQQVLQAAADGSRVGAMISFSLADEDLRAAARPSGHEADWDLRYGDEPLWSGNPNGALVREVDGLAPGRALDVGAGEGADAIWLAERGWRVTASDISRRALERIAAAAAHRDVRVECHHADANTLHAFEAAAFDLVCAQYASIPRTPDSRAVRNLMDAVAPGGTLLVVSHDLEPMRAPVDTRTDSRPQDPDAYVRVDDVAAALADSPTWQIEVHERRPRPPGAVSTHHVDDVVLRARRRTA